uniref:signal recognition particle 19 kDa protein isoform X2 n=1 Tax=Myxine glutinosa TaxID=7769 RepID=UPI00358DFCC5
MSHLGKTYDDKERFICVYPAYINSKKTVAEGRRISKEKNKMYPREWNRDLQFRGRVRVQLRSADGKPCLESLASRKAVFKYAAEMIPKLKSRFQRAGGAEQGAGPGEGGKKGKRKKK